MEVREHGRYIIRMDGSGRCTLRNRRFLRRCQPFSVDQAMPTSPMHITPQVPPLPSDMKIDNIGQMDTTRASQVSHDNGTPLNLSDGHNNPRDQRLVCPMTIPEVGCADSDITDSEPPPMPPTRRMPAASPRRSNRQRRPRRALSPSLRGKSHTTSCREIPGISAAVGPQGEGGDVEYVSTL